MDKGEDSSRQLVAILLIIVPALSAFALHNL